jgi:hypothetical protein
MLKLLGMAGYGNSMGRDWGSSLMQTAGSRCFKEIFSACCSSFAACLPDRTPEPNSCQEILTSQFQPLYIL